MLVVQRQDFGFSAQLHGRVVGLVGLFASVRTRPLTQRARRLADGSQDLEVVVDRGCIRSHIELAAGIPTTLRFERYDDNACTEMLVSELWPSAHRLVPNGETPVRFTPQRPGRYAFTCGMGMYSGEIVVLGVT